MRWNEIKQLVEECTYGDWKFELTQLGTVASYLQVVAIVEDSKNPGTLLHWKGRKWWISHFMTDSEVVQTCFLAVMTCVEHEAREGFKWKGRAVFGPHINVRELHNICDNLDVRS